MLISTIIQSNMGVLATSDKKHTIMANKVGRNCVYKMRNIFVSNSCCCPNNIRRINIKFTLRFFFFISKSLVLLKCYILKLNISNLELRTSLSISLTLASRCVFTLYRTNRKKVNLKIQVLFNFNFN